MVCSDCHEDMKKTGVVVCPYCKGNLVKVQ
jgi:DNA-directed RNA polymerase subunit RPC12/RpoP